MYFNETKHHEILFNGSACYLGKFHWYLQKAETIIHDLLYVKYSDDNGLKPLTFTTFGQEILSPDPIEWWIYKKEQNIDELLEKTKKVKESAETLKRRIYDFRDKYDETEYKDLIYSLKTFTEKNKEHILKLYEYGRYLNLKDPMAPIILFSHPPWPTTDLSERSIKIVVQNIEEENEKRLNLCTETALGLSYYYQHTIDITSLSISSDIADSMDPEDGYYINVPKNELYSQTQRKVINELATYFLNVREAIRIILERINTFKKKINVMYKQDFWINWNNNVIIQNNRLEDELFDVKESLDMWDGITKENRKKGKVKFTKAVATYANTKGGVMILGISNTRIIKGLNGLENKTKDIHNVIKDMTTRKSSDFIKVVNLVLKENVKKFNIIVLIIAQTHDEIGVEEKNNGKKYIFPVRGGPGLIEDDYNLIKQRKRGIKEDNFRFIFELKEYLD